MTTSVEGSTNAPISRVLVLDKNTDQALQRLLQAALKDEIYLDASLKREDIHFIKRLGETVAFDSVAVPEPLAEWEAALLSADGIVTYRS